MKPKPGSGTFYVIWPGNTLGLSYSCWGLQGEPPKRYWLTFSISI